MSLNFIVNQYLELARVLGVGEEELKQYSDKDVYELVDFHTAGEQDSTVESVKENVVKDLANGVFRKEWRKKFFSISEPSVGKVVKKEKVSDEDDEHYGSGFLNNPFDSISHLCQVLKLPQSKFAQGWRLTECLLGEINGIPGSRGLLVATDGMTCVVFRTEESFFQGHMEWFVADDNQTEVEEEVNKAIFKNKSVSQQCKELDELF